MSEIESLQALVPRLAGFEDRPAVIAFDKDEKKSWTYAKLVQHARRLAAGLTNAGIEKGDRVAICAENSPEWFAACLGVLACGAVAVPIDVQLADDALRHVLQDSGVRHVFTSERLVQKVMHAVGRRKCELILLGKSSDGASGWKDWFAKPAEAANAVSPDDEAVLFYTSGTTGPPKGVPLTHRNLAYQINTIIAAKLVKRDDRVLLPLPLHHVYPFVMGVLMPLSLGLPIVLPYMLTGPQLMRAMREGEVTIIVGVPRLYRALMSGIESKAKASGRLTNLLFRGTLAISILLARMRMHVGRFLFGRIHREIGPQLRFLASGGAAIEPELAWKLEGLGWPVGTGYGLTETSPLLTLDKPGRARIGSVGRAIEGTGVRIDRVAEDGGQPVDTTEGEVVARGPGVFRGYLNLPEKTQEAFTEDGWFRTGDLGRLDKDGYLFITGRVKTLIVLEGGEKVQPDDLEESMQENAALREVGVLEREGKIVAVIRLGRGSGDAQVAEDEIRRAL